MTKTQFKGLKQELKTLAATIKSTKPTFRKAQSTFDKTTPYSPELFSEARNLETSLGRAQFEFRHKHIVYCLMRGRTRNEIEQPKNHMPNEAYIKTIMDVYGIPVKQDKSHDPWQYVIDWDKSDFVPKRAIPMLAKEHLEAV